jgi:hypothetical protein
MGQGSLCITDIYVEDIVESALLDIDCHDGAPVLGW